MIGEYQYEYDFIVAFHRNDEKAFNVVFDEYYKDLVYFATKLIGSTDIAEEIVSEAYLKLFKKAANFPSIANIRAFLRIATRNACYNHLDKEKHITKTHEEFAYLKVEKVQHSIDFINVEAELIELIAKEIEKLPGLQQKVFKLRYVEQIDAKKVAEQLGITYQVVLNQTHKALTLLRKMNKHTTNFTIPFFAILLL